MPYCVTYLNIRHDEFLDARLLKTASYITVLDKGSSIGVSKSISHLGSMTISLGLIIDKLISKSITLLSEMCSHVDFVALVYMAAQRR